jgi:hypothetical protein
MTDLQFQDVNAVCDSVCQSAHKNKTNDEAGTEGTTLDVTENLASVTD